MKQIQDLDDLTPDPQNANKGTRRGADMLRRSIDRHGAGRSIVVDRHGVVIGGNKTLEAAKDAGLGVRVVQTTGDQLVVVRRTDLDLVNDPGARELAYLDNRVGEVGLAWNAAQIQKDLLAGVNVQVAFLPDELNVVGAVMEQHEANLASAAASGSAALEDPTVDFREKVALEFDQTSHLTRWVAFIATLRERFPDAQTPAAAFDAFLQEQGL
jgi:hypothetical protein